MSDMIDLRKEMKKMLDNTKYKIMLQKTSKKIHCKCYNEKYHEAKNKCNICLGTGWVFKFEKHKAFKQDCTNSADSAILFTGAGQFSYNSKIFYFSHDVHPQAKDYIWEVTWKGEKPKSLQNLYRIQSIGEQRGENGRIEYYVALAELEVLDKDFRNFYVGKAWRDA